MCIRDRHWTVDDSAACVEADPDGWTRVEPRRTGPVVIRAELSSPAGDDDCPAGG